MSINWGWTPAHEKAWNSFQAFSDAVDVFRHRDPSDDELELFAATYDISIDRSAPGQIVLMDEICKARHVAESGAPLFETLVTLFSHRAVNMSFARIDRPDDYALPA